MKHQLLVNLTLGRARRVTMNGRTYIVAPVSMIVPGVLDGNKGKLLYVPEEVANNYQAWNGMPAVVNHPILLDANGKPVLDADGEPQYVSARDPQVMARYGVGHVYRTSIDEKLGAEAWIDVELANRVDPRVVKRLDAGEPMEVSTGLFTDDEPAPKGATYNGKHYDWIARNFRPDHLAILPDDRGACSLDDGCGININAKNPFAWMAGWFGKLAKMVSNQPSAELVTPMEDGQPAVNPSFFESCPRDEHGYCSTGGESGGSAAKFRVGQSISRKELEAAGFKQFRSVGIYSTEYKNAASGVRIRTEDNEQGKAVRIKSIIAGTKRASTNSQTGDDMNKQQRIQWLTANCSCWKGKKNATAALGAMDDDQLQALVNNAKLTIVVNAAKKAGSAKKLLVNADGTEEVAGVPLPELAALLGIEVNPATKPAQFIAELRAALEDVIAELTGEAPVDETMPDSGVVMVAPKDEEEVVAGNRRKQPVANFTAEQREDLEFARREKAKRKNALVQQLVGNVADDATRQRKAASLLKKPLVELEELVELLPPAVNQQPAPPTFTFFGPAGGGPAHLANTQGVDADDVLDLEETRKSYDKK